MELYFNDRAYNINDNILYEAYQINEEEQNAQTDNMKDIAKSVLTNHEALNMLLSKLNIKSEEVNKNDNNYENVIKNLTNLETLISNFKIN